MISLRLRSGGYTILEVIIVLTVSTILFATAVAAYSQQNRRTQFTESVQTFAQNLRDILNDVDTGYYPSMNDFQCTAGSSGNPVVPTTGSAKLGTNSGCVFMGRALEFTPSDAPDTFKIYTLVGRQLQEDSTTEPVASLDQAKTIALTNLVDTKALTAGVQVVRLAPGASGIAIVSDAGVNGAASSGFNTRSKLALVGGNISDAGFAGKLTNLSSSSIVAPGGSVNICLEEAGGGRQAVVRLGSTQGAISIDVRIDEAC